MCWNFSVLSQNYHQSDSLYTPKLTGASFVEKKYYGSPFVNPEWTQSTIVLNTGDTIVGEKIKYNGYVDEVMWINQRNYKKFTLDKPNIKEFWIQPDSTHSAHYMQISVPIYPGNQKLFLETTYEGNVALYIYHKIRRTGRYIERYEDITYELDILSPRDIYFLKLPDGRWIEMHKLRQRYFLKYFPEQKKAIIQLAKKNHLSFKIEDQCIELLRIIDQELLGHK
jgi:hypothetical protein